jgi:K+-sensing histidine kinase KdpD
MTLGSLNGKRPNVRIAFYALTSKHSTLRRYPYLTAVLSVAIAISFVFVVRWLFNFPPLILFAGAVAFCFQVLGLRPGLLALLLSALTADFFFVEPVLTLTHHSLILGAYYLAAAVLCGLLARRSIAH